MLYEPLVQNDRKQITRSPRDDSSPSEEEHPDPVPPIPIVLDDLLLVREPVLVPTVESSTIMHAENVDVLDFEAGRFELGDDPAEGAGGVGAGEDVFVHEETPIRRISHGRP